ncbi:M1 family metallopeptidase [Pelolinea submarina]|uniref:Peptidase M1-like protein n=1 Tax=Pelolinea submarina TaxID=913107 RepID=A0A347ZVS1_9CHLR|nr:M1 family metallopeptidase [Pelolinea submarina]REG07098.1 peptidase M1-like protein [Pelolinea submarina]BBB49402.1 hypothetical protein Pelsub_P2633 [Pelolinea submarina]
MTLTNRLLISLILLFSLAGCASLPAVQTQIANQAEGRSQVTPTAADPLAQYDANLVETYQPVLAEMKTATRYRIEIEIADSISAIAGYQKVLYSNNEDVPLKEVYFRLFPNNSGSYMTVSDLKVDGEPVQVVLDHRNTAMRVELPDELQPGQSVSICMDFNQTVPSEMGGNYGLYVYLDEILSLDQFFPIIPVYNEEGWNVEDPPINADMLYSDEAFFDVQVSAPSQLVLAGSGVAISSSDQDGRQVVRYAGGPQRDFFLAASPLFLSASRKVGDTKVTSFFLDEYRDGGMLVLESAVHALESYNERFGLYPYTELDLISTPMFAGGMEYSSAVSLSLYYYNPDHNIGNLTFLESVVAHEIAHQWFFNQVMSDQIEEPWLDESLVQYATYLYYVDRYGENNAEGFVDSWYQRWASVKLESIPIGMPAAAYSEDEYGPIVYGRGPLFFAALKEKLGEDELNTLLRTYTDEYRWGIADGQKFKTLAEETCACDLTPLFEEWVY